jgi:hypothetical protein
MGLAEGKGIFRCAGPRPGPGAWAPVLITRKDVKWILESQCTMKIHFRKRSFTFSGPTGESAEVPF